MEIDHKSSFKEKFQILKHPILQKNIPSVQKNDPFLWRTVSLLFYGERLYFNCVLFLRMVPVFMEKGSMYTKKYRHI
jgi:hypothetical protein